MKDFVVYVVLFALVFLIFAVTSNSHTNPKIVKRKAAVCKVFGPRYCRQAIGIVDCETGRKWNIWAGYPHNEYWGLFQMGSRERRIYGHGWNVWAQARAAKRYFFASGRDWSPWPTCRWEVL